MRIAMEIFQKAKFLEQRVKSSYICKNAFARKPPRFAHANQNDWTAKRP